MTQLETVRREAEGLLGVGFRWGLPLKVSADVIRRHLAANGVAQPTDLLAFTSNGRVSDSQVVDWDAPDGGEAVLQ